MISEFKNLPHIKNLAKNESIWRSFMRFTDFGAAIGADSERLDNRNNFLKKQKNRGENFKNF